MNKLSNLKFLYCGAVFILVASCGKPGAKNNGAVRKASSALVGCEQYNIRFNDCEIQKVYTSKMIENDSGKLVPISKDPMTVAYTKSNVPSELLNEWEFGDVFSVFKGYINIGHNVSVEDIRNVIAKAQGFSRYSEIKRYNGTSYFESSYHSNASWKRIPDQASGRLTPGGEFSNFVLSLSASGVSVSVKSSAFFEAEDQKLNFYLRNSKPVSTFLTGVIVNPDGVRLKWEIYPYRNGFLVYGVAIIKAEKFKQEIYNVFSNEFSQAVFSWLNK